MSNRYLNSLSLSFSSGIFPKKFAQYYQFRNEGLLLLSVFSIFFIILTLDAQKLRTNKTV